MTEGVLNTRDFSAMQTGKPFKTYVKTVLGKVYITILEPFSGQPMGYLLEGNPRKNDEHSMIDVWSANEDVYFRRTNKGFFDNGTIIEYTRPQEEKVKEQTIESYSDEQLKELISQKWYAFQATLNKINTEAVLFRMINLTKEMEKSEKYINQVKARLSEVQNTKPVKEPEEDYS
jgi:hypothetical protein